MTGIGTFSSIKSQYANVSSNEKQLNLVVDDKSTNLHKATTRKTHSTPGPDPQTVKKGADVIAKSIDKELGTQGFGKAILSKLGFTEGVTINNLKAIAKEVESHRRSAIFGATTHNQSFEDVLSKHSNGDSDHTLRFSIIDDLKRDGELYEHTVDRGSRDHAKFSFLGMKFNVFPSSARKQMGVDYIARSINNSLDTSGLTKDQIKELGIKTGPEILKDLGITGSVKIRDLDSIENVLTEQKGKINELKANILAETQAKDKIGLMMDQRKLPEMHDDSFLDHKLHVDVGSKIKISEDGSGGVTFVKNESGQSSVLKIEHPMNMMKTKHTSDLVERMRSESISLPIGVPQQEVISVKKESLEFKTLDQKFEDLKTESDPSTRAFKKSKSYQQDLQNGVVVKSEWLDGKTLSDYKVEEKVELFKTKQMPNDLGMASIIGAGMGLSDHMGLNGLGYSNMDNLFLTSDGHLKFIDMDSSMVLPPPHLEQKPQDPLFRDLDNVIETKYGFSDQAMKNSIGDVMTFLEKITDSNVDFEQTLQDEINQTVSTPDHPLQQIISSAITPAGASALFKNEDTDRVNDLLTDDDKKAFVARLIGGVIDGLQWMSDNAEKLGDVHDSMKPNIVMENPKQTFSDLKSTIDDKLETIQRNFNQQFDTYL